jgi:hypothetical protein
MKIKTLRLVVVSVALLISLTSAISGLSDTLKSGRTPKQLETHASGLTARVTFPDGTDRTVTLDGVGCSAAICSRVFIEARSNDGSVARIWIDTLSAVRDIRPDSALFVMKDGSQRRLSLITDFRVLYVNKGSTRTEKLDLSKIQSLEMLSIAK